MKKVLWVVVAYFLSFSYGNAQEPVFTTDNQVINLGLGLGSTLYGFGYHTLIPPVSISYEKGIKDDVIDKGSIGVGPYIGFASAQYKYRDPYGSYKWTYTNFILGGRASFHYPILDDLDTYAGILLGFDFVGSRYTATGLYETTVQSAALGSGLVWSGYVGGRYWFSDRFAAMMELGYGIAYLNVGIAIGL